MEAVQRRTTNLFLICAFDTTTCSYLVLSNRAQLALDEALFPCFMLNTPLSLIFLIYVSTAILWRPEIWDDFATEKRSLVVLAFALALVCALLIFCGMPLMDSSVQVYVLLFRLGTFIPCYDRWDAVGLG